MVSMENINKQLYSINFHRSLWGKAEVDELVNILMPDEIIYECVNGNYEGGFALLVVTSERVLLIDKKIFNFLTVEDMRFNLINQIDYSCRLVGAYINISAGFKSLKFSSFNKNRLRKLVNHIQLLISYSNQRQPIQSEDKVKRLENINDYLDEYFDVKKIKNIEDLSLKHKLLQNIGYEPKDKYYTLIEMARKELFEKKTVASKFKLNYHNKENKSHEYDSKTSSRLGRLVVGYMTRWLSTN